jgi:two-component system sensor histidine kinase/response regulator
VIGHSLNKTKSNVMVVDDNPANLKLLEDMLQQQGYQVRSFPRGRLALASAAKNPPDLILLDINMPEMDGYEVCEQLKIDGNLAQIPVIFLSALDETADKVKAFRSGGVDYVTKPFQVDEIRARVETQIELHNLQRSLQMHNGHLEELVGARTRELADAYTRLKILEGAKSEFLNLISHEFRTPLNGLLGIGELILDELDSSPEGHELREMFEESRRRILTILEDALLLTQIDVEPEKFAAVPLDLASILSVAIARAEEFARSREVTLASAPVDVGYVFGVDDLLIKALKALIETAARFSNAGEAVRLSLHSIEGDIQVVIESSGRAIPDAAIHKFFDIFAVGEESTPGGDIGLEAAVAYRILALFGGSVAVENRESSGIRLTVMLKCGQPRTNFQARINQGSEKVESGSNSVVECQLPKLDVAGSTPVSRSIK